MRKVRRLNFPRAHAGGTFLFPILERNTCVHKFIYVHDFSSLTRRHAYAILKRKKREKSEKRKRNTRNSFITCISICSRIFIRDIYLAVDQYRDIRCNNLLTFHVGPSNSPFSLHSFFPLDFLFYFYPSSYSGPVDHSLAAIILFPMFLIYIFLFTSSQVECDTKLFTF